MCSDCDSPTTDYPLPPRRERRRSMKKMTSRKVSSQDRININRFWNEMEDFYSRQQDELAACTWSCDREVEAVTGRAESPAGSCYSSASSLPSPPSSPPPAPSDLSALPLPPSLPHTRLLLGLVERLRISRISTDV
jgi:hypothetical protein